MICTGESATITAGGAASYTWATGSNSASIIVSPTINVVYNYSLSGADANGCIGVANASLQVNQCTGILSYSDTKSHVKIYPNPAKNTLSLESASSIQMVEVYDLNGRLLIRDKVSDQVKYTLDIHNLPASIYVVKTTHEGGHVSQQKFSVEK
jgi:hypothetical protein